MKTLLLAAALAAALALVRAKVYERCELARELLAVHRVPQDEVAVWVCIAQHESDYNTTAVGHVGEGGDHGIFQISDLYWCSHRGPGKACGVSCTQLLDNDIGDDVACVRRIHREHQGLSGNGFSAWAVYPLYCKRPERAAKYVEGCFPATGNEVHPVYGLPPFPAITAPPPPRYRPRPQPPTTTPRPAPIFGLPPSPVNSIVSRWFGPGPSRTQTQTQPVQAQAQAPPQRRAADPRNFWNWQFLPNRRWF